MSESKRVLCIGKICFDTVSLVNGFPDEDEEVFPLEQTFCRGGNAANTSVVLANLGENVEYFGVVFKDESKLNESVTLMLQAKTKLCLGDLNDHGVHSDNVVQRHLPKMCSTFIAINTKSGSRTMFIIDSDSQEPTYQEFAELNLTNYKWIHFEGRNVDQVLKMIDRILEHNKGNDDKVKFSVELEIPAVKNVHLMAENADLVLIGKLYAKYKGYSNPLDAASELRYLTKPGAYVVAAWGEHGAAYLVNDGGNKATIVDAIKPDAMVDTTGAGDTFNAAVIRALCAEKTLENAVEFGCKVASRKISQYGYDAVKGMGSILN